MKYIKYLIPVIILVTIFISSSFLESLLASSLVFISLFMYIVYLFVLAWYAKSRRQIYTAYMLNIFSFSVFIIVYFSVVLGLFLLWKR